VHQVFELWFKLILRDLLTARDLFSKPAIAEQDLSGAVFRLKRVTTILRIATQHWEVVETLQTRDFLKFRDKLMPASGFQSAQLRQIETLMGLAEEDRIPLGAATNALDSLLNADGTPSASHERVTRQLADTPCLRDAVSSWLCRTPIDGTPYDAPDSEERLQAFIERFLDAHAKEADETLEQACHVMKGPGTVERMTAMYAKEKESVRAFFNPTEEEGGMQRARARAAMLFIESYRDLPLLAWPREVLAVLIEVEQAFTIFRQRHARMVERVIGRRTGTGGSMGVAYLDKTALTYRIFADLWSVRTMIIKGDAAPDLENPEFYGFRNE